MSTLKPIGNKVLLKSIAVANRAVVGGIHVPESAQEKSSRYEVIELGTGGHLKNGNPIRFEMKEGDIVVINKHAGADAKVDGVSYLIVDALDVIGVIS